MIDWFLSGGVIMWPLLALALGVIGLAVRAAIELRRAAARPQEPPEPARRPALGTILFWGGVALLVGALGTVVGIVIMSRSVAAAGEASGALIWGGVGVSLVSLIFGILIFLLAGLLWLPLEAWRSRVFNGLAGGA